MGRSRALEVCLGCNDFTAEEAERYGYINRALPAEDLDDFVTDLAQRIASFPQSAIQATKQAVDYSDSALSAGLLEEQHLFNQTRSTIEAQTRMAKFMALGAQTREGELDLDSIIRKL
jgi:enoyl-CoA hydratase/carnithine racemase